MAEIFGHRWTSAFGDDAVAGAGETWAKALGDLTPHQLAAGIEACAVASDPWPPTLPEFRALCLGIPSFASISQELLQNRGDRTQFAVLVWANLDAHRWRQSTAEQGERQLRSAYDLAREHIMRGGSLPEAPRALVGHDAPEPRRRASPEVARAAMAQILAATAADTMPRPPQAGPAATLGHHAASAPRHGAPNTDDRP